MTFWLPNPKINIFEEEISIKIEAHYSELKRLKMQAISVVSLLNSAEAHIYMLEENWAYLKNKAKVISLLEVKSLIKSLNSIKKDSF